MNKRIYYAPRAINVQLRSRIAILSGSLTEMGSGSTTDFNDEGDISDAFDED